MMIVTKYTTARKPSQPDLHRVLPLLLYMVALVACHQRAVAEDKLDVHAVCKVVERSVPFIERKGAEWITTKDCLSCHHTAFMVWSLDAAKKKGIPVDQKKLDDVMGWTTDWHHLVVQASRAAADRQVTVRGQSDTIAQLLLGQATVVSSVNQPRWAVEYAKDLLKAQQDDGSWSSGGQLPSQKRPKRETQEVSTMWVLLALNSSHIPDDSLPARVAKARTWLGEQTAGESTEWWATRSMIEQKLDNADKAGHVRAELVKRQRTDGGWGWLCRDDSDALATGIALFALGSDKSKPTQEAIGKARQFLARSQSADGSWPVRGTKQNHKDSIEPTSTFLGTCWAVIGLCESLDI